MMRRAGAVLIFLALSGCASTGVRFRSLPAETPAADNAASIKKAQDTLAQAAAAKAAEAPVAVPNGSNPPPMASSLVRQNTMNSLSSGYAASAQRSVSGTVPTVGSITHDNTGPSRGAAFTTAVPENTPPASTGTRRNRVVAPPPAAYVSAPPTDEFSANGDTRPRGKMLYSYEARDDGELTVREGKEVTVLEPDGKYAR